MTNVLQVFLLHKINRNYILKTTSTPGFVKLIISVFKFCYCIETRYMQLFSVKMTKWYQNKLSDVYCFLILNIKLSLRKVARKLHKRMSCVSLKICKIKKILAPYGAKLVIFLDGKWHFSKPWCHLSLLFLSIIVYIILRS